MKAFSHSNMTETYCFRDIISLRFAQIVAFYKAYHLWNFQLVSFKIKARPIKNAKAYKKFMWVRGAVANFNIAQPTFTSAFNIVWIKPYHSTSVRLPVLCKLWTNPLINLNFLQGDDRP